MEVFAGILLGLKCAVYLYELQSYIIYYDALLIVSDHNDILSVSRQLYHLFEIICMY